MQVIQLFEQADYLAAIRQAADALTAGQLVVLPTETVYGAAALLTNPQARQRLQSLRGGESDTPLTIHLAKRDDAAKYLGTINDFAAKLMKKLWPGPVGLMFTVSPERRKEVARQLGVDENVLYDNGTIVLRCPDHPAATDVLALVTGPVVLSRAGELSNRPEDLPGELEGKVDLIMLAGQPQHAKPSTLLKVGEQSYDIVRAGVYDARIIERLLRTTILFVCSGNTCRSPMAEAIAKQVIAQRLNVSEAELEDKGIIVTSAGSFAMPGSRATPAGVEAVKEIGADLSTHRSRALSVELIHQADLILTMGASHAAAVTALVPGAAGKTLTLDPAGDIDDPIGGDLGLYQALAKTMVQLITSRLTERKILP